VPSATDHVIITSGTVTIPTNGVFAIMDWSGGQLQGALTVASNGVLNLSGSLEKDLYCPLTNSGTVTWTGTGELRVLYFPEINYHGTIYNLAGGLFDIQNNTLLDYYEHTEVFNNAGTVRKSAGSGNTTINPQFNNSGTVAALSGTLAFNGGFDLTGGELLFGMSSSSDYGKISVAGNVILGSSVGAVWLGGFVPASGATFTVLTYGSETGIFTNTDLPTTAHWQTNYTATSFILAVGGLNQLAFTTGEATFSDLSINLIGAKRLLASSPALTPATSAPFSIVPLFGVQWSIGGCLLQLNGTNSLGPTIIYGSTNLTFWAPLYTNPPTTNAIQFLDASATNIPARFYRTVEE
jgi:hypothetical protein